MFSKQDARKVKTVRSMCGASGYVVGDHAIIAFGDCRRDCTAKRASKCGFASVRTAELVSGWMYADDALDSILGEA